MEIALYIYFSNAGGIENVCLERAHCRCTLRWLFSARALFPRRRGRVRGWGLCADLSFWIFAGSGWPFPRPGSDETLLRRLITLDMCWMCVVSGLASLIAPTPSSVPHCRLLHSSSLSCLRPTHRVDGHPQPSRPRASTSHTSPRSP